MQIIGLDLAEILHFVSARISIIVLDDKKCSTLLHRKGASVVQPCIMQSCINILSFVGKNETYSYEFEGAYPIFTNCEPYHVRCLEQNLVYHPFLQI